MKIRTGFVSNSSSTSYVIALTRDFEFTNEMIEKIAQYDDYDDKVKTNDQIKKILKETVEKLCSGDGFFTEYDGYPELSSALVRVCRDDIQIASMDVGSEEGCIVNCLADDNKENLIRKLKHIL